MFIMWNKLKKTKSILLKQRRNKECFEALFECALNLENQLNNENIQKYFLNYFMK